MKRNTLMWSLTGISAALGFMLTVQITSRPQSSDTALSSYLDLRTQVAEQLYENKVLAADISKQNAQLAQYKAAAGSQAELQTALQQDAAAVAAEAGLTEQRGPGITISIKDDPKLPFYNQYADEFTQEADTIISQIVNDLFANGATAISINGQRLVTTSSIRLVAGLDPVATLQVNAYPISQPCVISAIGDIHHMMAVLTVNNTKLLLNLMQEDCVIKEHSGQNGVFVPAYDGTLPGEFAKEVSNP